jgi:hypothetical protein
MKNKKISQILLLLVGVMMIFSCSENEDVYPETRLFRPVLNSNLTSQNNTIIVDMAKMTKAISYKIELSRDKFVTVLGTIDTPESTFRIVNLLWNTEYQIRVTAIAADPQYNSKVSDLGAITTQKFPSILQSPTEFDVIDVAAKLTWAIGPLTGAPITQVKVFAIADETLSSPLLTIPVTSAEQLAGVKIVNGLTPSTEYQIAIYSGDEVRGWEKYKTKVGIVVDANTIDLRGIVPTSTLLFDTLTAAPAGSTIILDGNVTYDLSTSYFFNKSLTIKSGYSFGQGGAIVNLISNFNILAGSNVGAIIFEGLILTSPDTAAAAKYVFNINQSSTIGEIAFNNCRMSNYRGVCRFQASTGTIGKYTVNNCIINNIGGYGVFNVDVATWTAGDVLFKNSTVYRSTVFMASKSTSPTKSVTIEDCTLNEFVAKAGTMFKWVNEVTNGITMRNTIVGHGYDNTGGTDYSIIGYSGLATTTWIILNTYSTSDFVYVPLKPTIPGFPSFTYPKKVESLWINPVSGDFNIKDPSFAGVKDSGDPRWRK